MSLFCAVFFQIMFFQNGQTALMWAAHGDFTECARLLVEAGADKDAQDNVRMINDISRALISLS
jgi:hypothetical protein